MNVSIEFNLIEFVNKLSEEQKRQFLKCLNEGKNKLTSTLEFKSLVRYVASKRLLNILDYFIEYEPDLYIENITKEKFCRYRNAGNYSWNEFIKLQQKYL